MDAKWTEGDGGQKEPKWVDVYRTIPLLPLFPINISLSIDYQLCCKENSTILISLVSAAKYSL